MKKILIVDTETTGLDPDQGACLVEVGAILFSVEHRAVLQQLSFLLPVSSNPVQSVNGIDPAITQLEMSTHHALSLFREMVVHCDALVAHNVSFDQPWLEQFFGPLGKPWVCTMSDFDWPGLGEGAPSVTRLALAHGVPVWALHRALTDCIYVAQVFERCTDLPGMLAAAMAPRATFRAHVSYDQRDLAKQAGFHWNSQRKLWLRRLPADTTQDTAGFPFGISVVTDLS